MENISPESIDIPEQEASHEKVSPTAKFIAYLRTFTDIPFVHELAEESHSKETFDSLLGDQSKVIQRFAPLMEARYKVTRKILEDRNIHQVLELACGLSPRALEMTQNPDIAYVATDLPTILEQAKSITERILSRINGDRPNLHFQTANALDSVSLSEASKFFSAQEPLAVVNEGLLIYLNRAEKKKVIANIRELISGNRGIWITPDAITQTDMSKTYQVNEGLQKIAEEVSGITQRDMFSNAFVDEDDVRRFFEEEGFAIEEHGHPGSIEDLSSIQTLGVARETVVKLLEGRKTLVLTLKN